VKTSVPIPERVRRLPLYSTPIEDREGALRLDFNENTLGALPAVMKAIRRLTAEQIAMYPDYAGTIAKLAKHFGVRPAEMHLTNGADGAIGQVARTFLEEGDSILIATPTFPMYAIHAAMAGARVEALSYDPAGGLPIEEVLRALKKSKPWIFFLANPNNPTGTLVKRADVRKMIEASPKTLVVADEAYFEFCRETVLPWIRRYGNLVVLRTFSKATGMAGLRLGCIFACPELMQWFARTRDPFPVNNAALAAAEAVVRDSKTIRKYAEEVRAAREYLAEALGERGIHALPSAANFLLADFGAKRATVLAKLAKRGILLRSREGDFGRSGFVRVTVGTRPQMRRLVRELDKLL
jgi:histidinol-phosphate aminotransferase